MPPLPAHAPLGALIAACSLLLGACAATVPLRHQQQSIVRGDQGGAWETVFSTPDFAAARSEPGDHPEFARRDRHLALADDGPLLATGQWPEPARADLRDYRRIAIADTERTGVFYFPDARYRTHPNYHHHHGDHRAPYVYPR